MFLDLRGYAADGELSHISLYIILDYVGRREEGGGSGGERVQGGGWWVESGGYKVKCGERKWRIEGGRSG